MTSPSPSPRASHKTPDGLAKYRQQYSSYKTLLVNRSDEMVELLSSIYEHPNLPCIHLPALYSQLYSIHKGRAARTRMQIYNHKILSLRDVLSFLDSLSFGVIR